MKGAADLHLHTIASDGALTPASIVGAAARLGLAAVAITDHDTVDGIDEALSAGASLGIEVIPGIEISATYTHGVEAHILGYFIDHHDHVLLDKLRFLKEARLRRGMKMVELLNTVGVPVTFERVAEIARGGAVGRPHVARAICEVGAASSMDSAFGRFLIEGGPGYVPRHTVAPAEAVRMILDAGGVACCAHVAKLRRDELVLDLAAVGLRAIEVHHPDHSPASTKFYKQFAQKHGLIATGGSDAHMFVGDKHGGIGHIAVSYEVVLALKEEVEG